MDNIRKNLISVGHWEGISYLVLLLIAMPVKYMLGFPIAVRLVGSLHGVLFIIYCIMLWQAYKKLPLTSSLSIKLFILSVIPFGTFFIKGMLPKSVDH